MSRWFVLLQILKLLMGSAQMNTVDHSPTNFYAYNIYGSDSDSPRVSNVYVTGGSTGFWCKNCPHGKVSHFKAENLHGPFPRGQCFQVVSSTGFTLEDFTCVQDNQIAFPEDDISVWDSPYSTVQRGLIQGGTIGTRPLACAPWHAPLGMPTRQVTQMMPVDMQRSACGAYHTPLRHAIHIVEMHECR